MTVTFRSPMAEATRTLIVGLATARLTRLVTSDWLGEWTIVRPAKRWAIRHESPIHGIMSIGDNPETHSEAARMLREDEPDPVNGWRSKLVKGLDCPFCVGFWIGLLVLIGESTLGRLPIIGAIWRLGIGALALNYVVAHVSSKID